MEPTEEEKRFRKYEINSLYLLFKSYGYEIPRRKTAYLRNIKKADEVDMREFMADSGYSCCEKSVEALRDGYLSWNASRMSLDEYLQMEKEKDEYSEANDDSN